ncbi:hypothetical protein GQ457_05G002770 [Hibiscus cannabinus]
MLWLASVEPNAALATSVMLFYHSLKLPCSLNLNRFSTKKNFFGNKNHVRTGSPLAIGIRLISTNVLSSIKELIGSLNFSSVMVNGVMMIRFFKMKLYLFFKNFSPMTMW